MKTDSIGAASTGLISVLAAFIVFGSFSFASEFEPGASAGSASVSTGAFPSFTDIVKKEKPSVVNISSTSLVKGAPASPFEPFRDYFGDDFFERFFGRPPQEEMQTRSLGSGFIISSDGFILTNYHVVENAQEIIVRLADEREFEAKVVGKDAKTDVALIRVEEGRDFPAVKMGDSDALEVGEWVIAIGNPFGVGQTVTAGIVSAKGRVIGAGPYDDFIQTDASINPGNSGGPLYNVKGEVVGINAAIYSPSGVNVGIGFAIPINMVKAILPQLREKGKVTRGWLGVMIQPLTEELAKTFNLPSTEGALVGDVVNGSPADKAGIRRGDVILEFDGRKIEKMRELPFIVAQTSPGKKADIKIMRGGKEKVVTVEIEELKEKAVEVADTSAGVLGMTVREITPDIARQLELESTKGVIISDVRPGSPADAAGLQRGDVIIEINRKNIADLDDYRRETAGIKKGDTLLMLVKRGENIFFATLGIKEEMSGNQ